MLCRSREVLYIEYRITLVKLNVVYLFFLLPVFLMYVFIYLFCLIMLTCYNIIWIAGKGRQHKLMLKNKLDNILLFRWADGWSNSARSVKEGGYMNHFKFSDTLGGYSLIPRANPQWERKRSWLQFKMNSVIYSAGNQSQNRQILWSAKN